MARALHGDRLTAFNLLNHPDAWVCVPSDKTCRLAFTLKHTQWVAASACLCAGAIAEVAWKTGSVPRTIDDLRGIPHRGGHDFGLLGGLIHREDGCVEIARDTVYGFIVAREIIEKSDLHLAVMRVASLVRGQKVGTSIDILPAVAA